MSNFSGFNRTQNTGFFNHFNPLYDNERKLYDLLITEAFNFHGLSLTYSVVSYDVDKDRILGEDNTRQILRAFDFMAYLELPRDIRNFSTMGMGWNDIFHIHASKRHFAKASKFRNGVMTEESYIPRAGDIIRLSYNELKDPTRTTRLDTDTPNPNDFLREAAFNNTYYEITMVKQQTEQFLQGQHSWDMIVRTHRDKSIPISGTSGDGSNTEPEFGDMWKYTNKSDMFDIGKFINTTTDAHTNKADIEYDGSKECPPKDPFNNWWSDK